VTTAVETKHLERLEAIVERGLSTFVEVGKALAEIRDRLLYREAGHETWDSYCRNRWGMSRIHAHRTIEASRIAGMLPTGNKMAPIHERTIRPLEASGLSDEQKVAAWEAAVETAEQEGEPVQERHVRFAVEHLYETRTPPLPNGKWQVLLADPPWQYDFSKSPSRDIENQYPTMPSEAIAALPVSDIAAEDCVLFLWVPSPKLPQGLTIMAAWGFDYKTCMVWVKDKIGMGYYARQQHELLLIGARGQLGLPSTDARPPSVILADRTNHSAKPAAVYGLIEAMYPQATKAELFARETREGWDSWGNQV
jgi:N6-adenosine-specific RNA methylase IME4